MEYEGNIIETEFDAPFSLSPSDSNSSSIDTNLRTDSTSSGGDGIAVMEGINRSDRLLGSATSIYSFTRAFSRFAHTLALRDSIHTNQGVDTDSVSPLITVDGGPHTLWW